MDTIETIFATVKQLTSTSPEKAPPAARIKAIVFLRQSIISHPHERSLKNKLAQLLTADGQFGEAEKLFPAEVDSNDWSMTRSRLDLYCAWIAKNPSTLLFNKCDDLMRVVANAHSVEARDLGGNYKKFKQVIGLYISLGRYDISSELVQCLYNRQSSLRPKLSYLQKQIDILHTAKTGAPAAIKQTGKNNSFLTAILAEIQGIKSGKDIHTDKKFEKRHGQLFMPGDNLVYTDSLESFIAGDSTSAIRALSSLFERDIFDPFAAIVILACSGEDAGLRDNMKAAFGANQYGRFLSIAAKLKRYRDTIIKDSAYPIPTSNAMLGVHIYPVNREAKRAIRSGKPQDNM